MYFRPFRLKLDHFRYTKIQLDSEAQRTQTKEMNKHGSFLEQQTQDTSQQYTIDHHLTNLLFLLSSSFFILFPPFVLHQLCLLHQGSLSTASFDSFCRRQRRKSLGTKLNTPQQQVKPQINQIRGNWYKVNYLVKKWKKILIIILRINKTKSIGQIVTSDMSDSVVVVAAVHTRPRAIPLDMITMRKLIYGFPLLFSMGMGSVLAALRSNMNINAL